MDADEDDRGLVDRLSRSSEEALGRVAEQLAGNPVIAGALARAFSAREKTVQAQEAAMGALGIPSAADIERLTRRLRSVSQRLEGIEDVLDRVETRLDSAARAEPDDDGRTVALEGRLEEISRDLRALRDTLAPGHELPPRAQERLSVSEATATPAARRRSSRSAARSRPG